MWLFRPGLRQAIAHQLAASPLAHLLLFRRVPLIHSRKVGPMIRKLTMQLALAIGISFVPSLAQLAHAQASRIDYRNTLTTLFSSDVMLVDSVDSNSNQI